MVTVLNACYNRCVALCIKFTCDHCGFSVDFWDAGNRYLEWPAGTRNYLYHPSDQYKTAELMQKIYGRPPTADEYTKAFQSYGGNESEFLCEQCAAISRIDPERDPEVCKMCGSRSLRETRELAKTPCPSCHSSHFDCGKPGGIS